MNDVIAHSPLWTPSCEMPNRIVIREHPTEFVVHTEIHDPGCPEPYYHQGDYFAFAQNAESRRYALKLAWARFLVRATRQLGFQHEPIVSQ